MARILHYGLTAGLTAGLLAISCAAHSAGVLPMTGDQELYLSVRLDEQPTTLIARFRLQSGRLMARGADLAQLGLDAEKLGIGPAQDVALDEIPGLIHHYDASLQTVALHTREGLRKPLRIDARGLPVSGAASSDHGLLLNYDVYGRKADTTRVSAWTELRWFDPLGVTSHTGVAHSYRGQYIRHDSSWTHTDQQGMRTLRLGDSETGALPWTRSLRLGGIQLASNFATRPDLLTFPMPMLGGSTAVPGAVDVYINNIRRYSGELPGGPFVIDNVTGLTGYGQANVVTRDALGRPVSLALPIYIDTRLLAQGLSSHSVEAGFLRRDYGWRSYAYASAPAFSGAYQYGLSDSLTLQAQAQASAGLVNAGIGALFRLGMLGVLSGSVASSHGRHAGLQWGLGYQYAASRFSVDLSTLRAVRDYGDLGSLAASPITRSQDQITLSWPLGERQSMALSYIGVRYPASEPARIASIACNTSIARHMMAGVSAYQDLTRRDTRGFLFSLSIAWDKVAATTSAGRQNGRSSMQASATRTPDPAGGTGWGLQSGQSGQTRYAQAWLRHLGPFGESAAGLESQAGRNSATLDMNGSLVLMDGRVHPARRISDAFALVSTDGRPGVPVQYQSSEAGRSDRHGYLVLADLNSYQQNRIDIGTQDLPANTAVDTMTQTAIPQARSGLMLRFGLRQQNAAAIRLHDPQGRPLPAGARITHRETGEQSVVGYEGLSFFTRLQADNHFEVSQDDQLCVAALAYTAPADGSLPQLGPAACLPIAR